MVEKICAVQIHGTKEEKDDLHAVFDLLMSCPEGEKLAKTLVAKDEFYVLGFDQNLNAYSKHEVNKGKIFLRPFKKDKDGQDKAIYLKRLACVLGGELARIVVEDAYVGMIQNSMHLNDVLLAELMREVGARLVSESLEQQLLSGGSQRILTAEDKKKYVLDALRGKKEWAWPCIKKTTELYKGVSRLLSASFSRGDPLAERIAIVNMQPESYSMPRIPRPTEFDRSMNKIIKMMGADLLAGEAREVRVPLRKQSKLRQSLSGVSLKKAMRQFVMHLK